MLQSATLGSQAVTCRVPLPQVRTASPVLDIAVLPERNLIACALADGGVSLHACDSGALLSDAWRPLAFDGSQGYSGERTRAIAFVPVADGGHCVVVGGSDGAMHACPLVLYGPSYTPAPVYS